LPELTRDEMLTLAGQWDAHAYVLERSARHARPMAGEARASAAGLPKPHPPRDRGEASRAES